MAAWDVKAAPLDGVVTFTDRGAMRVLRGPALGQSAAVEVGHAPGSFIDGLAFGRGELLSGLLEAGLGDAELLGGQLHMVELLCVGEYGSVTAVTHVSNDASHRRADVGRSFAITNEGTEAGKEVGGVGLEDGHGLSGSGR